MKQPSAMCLPPACKPYLEQLKKLSLSLRQRLTGQDFQEIAKVISTVEGYPLDLHPSFC